VRLCVCLSSPLSRFYYASTTLPDVPISVQTRLAIVLRFLAGGLVEDLRMIYCMHMSEVYRTTWKGVDAINDALPVDLEWVQDPSKLEVLEREFRARSRVKTWTGQVRRTKPGRLWPTASD
jgi:hypothetical protein